MLHSTCIHVHINMPPPPPQPRMHHTHEPMCLNPHIQMVPLGCSQALPILAVFHAAVTPANPHPHATRCTLWHLQLVPVSPCCPHMAPRPPVDVLCPYAYSPHASGPSWTTPTHSMHLMCSDHPQPSPMHPNLHRHALRPTIGLTHAPRTPQYALAVPTLPQYVPSHDKMPGTPTTPVGHQSSPSGIKHASLSLDQVWTRTRHI